MKDKELYEWLDESFEDKVKREMALPAWERPSLIRNFLQSSHTPFYERMAGMRMAL